MPLTLAVAVASYFTALLSGVAGLGGGTVLIGIFYAIGLAPAIAVPLHAAVQLISNASRTLAYLKFVQWRAALWFLVGALPGPFLIAPWVQQANPYALDLLMALLVGASLLPEKKSAVQLPTWAAILCAGLLNGSLGMFIGATGLVIGRLFLRPEWRKESVIGTLALCQSLGHASKIAGFATLGLSALARIDILAPLAIATVLGTLSGRWLHRYVSEALFQKVFKSILAVLAVKLAYDGLSGLPWH
ncbi:MAG TPA: sulfite exporter TauE/SafE family protein [Nevskiaceae bacterium]|nr:sulfite exporter TauE/SafE family protein [Nevskiaceae bacterium]